MTEKEKMLAGKLFDPADTQLFDERQNARRLCRLLNESTETEMDKRKAILKELFKSNEEPPWIELPFRCDYGSNISFGKKVFLNFDCVILDTAKIHIGDYVLIGPKVQITAPQHPIDPEQRRTYFETSAEINIHNDVWLGSGSIICPGVTIGEGSVIGAGSVVTKDIPAGVVAVGNPCKVLRPICPEDKVSPQ
ncbi:putative maltose O-acetyltransferase [Lentisphaera araneosa HTCC2155]|jgi:maltose O-acetyltransferase|uniref:Putative maltose O-acetyltransferase n=1 Tax=Lentisphaera araneosa HTCC2155 TaxID=313628 RepID=A6DNE1_9BACT|nr:sugar O-acetyltransferase [Lentisphaera araneosa]EDM26889.1 putative maltose O-acetyltransferase [Lentisphaera araneosa HTCC2155]